MPSMIFNEAVGVVASTGYRNYLPFGQQLRQFLQTPAQLELLPSVGWMDGGCLILSDALVGWGRGQLRAGATLRRLPDNTPFMDHAFVYNRTIGKGRLLLDGEGVSDETLLIKRLELFSGVQKFEVRYEDCAQYAVGILRDPRASKLLTRALLQQFGPFKEALLSPIN